MEHAAHPGVCRCLARSFLAAMLQEKMPTAVFVCWCFWPHPSAPHCWACCWVFWCCSFLRTGLHAAAEELVQIAALAEGLSGRALRKLPFQAHAFFVQVRKAQRLPVVRKTPAAQLLCGLVWSGLFWFDLVWFGLVWVGWIWSRSAFCFCSFLFFFSFLL